MGELDSILRNMTPDFFGGRRQKTSPEALFNTKHAVFLDVRSVPEQREVLFVPDQSLEQQSLDLSLEHHITVLRIPVDEIPDGVDEIPGDRLIAVFCSAGTRANVVYPYLRTKGHTDLRIVHGVCKVIADAIKPASPWQHLEQKRRP